MSPGHPIILLKSNKFNMAAVSVIECRGTKYLTYNANQAQEERDCRRFEKMYPTRNGFASKAIRRHSAFLEVCSRNSLYVLRCNDRQQGLHYSCICKIHVSDIFPTDWVENSRSAITPWAPTGSEWYPVSVLYMNIVCDMYIVGKRFIWKTKSYITKFSYNSHNIYVLKTIPCKI